MAQRQPEGDGYLMRTMARAISMLFVVAFVLLGCSAAPATQSNATPTSDQALATSSTATRTPMPAATLMNNTPTVAQTSTLVSSTPTSPAILPTPNGTFDMNYYLTPPVFTPEPTFPPPPTPQAPIPPSAITLSNEPINLSNGATPLIWAAQASDSLTIWEGYFSESPTPHLQGNHPIVRWNLPLSVSYMAVSPSRTFLSLIATNRNRSEGEPSWLYVINLTSNAVTFTPNPYYADPATIVGWIDESRFVIEPAAGAEIANRSGAPLTSAVPPQSSKAFISDVALSQNRAMLFYLAVGAGADDGYWLSNIDNSSTHHIVADKDRRPIHAPVWSPSGSYIGFLSPDLPDDTQMRPWLLDTNTYAMRSIGEKGVWDAGLTWSPDATKLAFLQADTLPAPSEGWYETPELPSTNVFTVDLASLQPKQLTHFSGTHNNGLSWSPDGRYLILSSTQGGQLGASGLLAISASSGQSVSLLPGSAAANNVRPLLLQP